MKTIEEKFKEYLELHNHKLSSNRLAIIDVLENTNKHLTTEELYNTVKLRKLKVSHTTIHRTLKLLCEAGLGKGLQYNDGVTRYELEYGHEHHDHLVCTGCGSFIEVSEPKIEEMQKKLVKKYKFKPAHHRLEIYGVCEKCSK